MRGKKGALLAVLLIALTLVAACAGGGGGSSPAVNPVANAVAITDSAASHYSSVVSGGSGTGTLNPHDALIDTANWLATQNSIKSTIVSTSQDILFVEYKDGTRIVMDATTSSLTPTLSSPTPTLSLKTSGTNRKSSTMKALQSANACSPHALILEPTKSAISCIAPAEIGIVLNNNNFIVNYLADSDVTLDVFTTLSNYNFILFNGHSLYDASTNIQLLCTGEQYSDTKGLEYLGKYGLTRNWTIVYQLKLGTKYFALAPSFISLYSKFLMADTILLNACNSLNSQSPLYSILLANGAKSVIGWTNTVRPDNINQSINEEIVNNLISGQTVSASLIGITNNGVGNSPDGTTLITYSGDGSAKLASASSSIMRTSTIPKNTQFDFSTCSTVSTGGDILYESIGSGNNTDGMAFTSLLGNGACGYELSLYSGFLNYMNNPLLAAPTGVGCFSKETVYYNNGMFDFRGDGIIWFMTSEHMFAMAFVRSADANSVTINWVYPYGSYTY